MGLLLIGLLTGARLSGCRSRSLDWTDANEETTSIRLLASQTDTVIAARDGLLPIQSGSQWSADDVSRLVLFSHDIRGPMGLDGSQFRLERSNHPAPAAQISGRAIELPWQRTGTNFASGIQSISLSPNLSEARSVRNVDIGMCSFHIPWFINQGTPADPVLDTLGFGEGDGIAEQLINQFETNFQSDASGIHSGVITAVVPMNGHDSSFFIRFHENHGDDEICIRTNWRIAFNVPGLTLCGPQDASVQFCGRFYAQDDSVKFDVTSADASIHRYRRIRFLCNAFRKQIASNIRDSLWSKVGQSIEDAFSEQLRVTEMIVPPFVVSSCGGRTGIDCASEFHGTCTRDNRPVCEWNLPVSRVEILPSRIELVMAETESSRLLRILTDDRVSGVGGPIAQMICRTPESLDYGGPPALDRNAIETTFTDNGGQRVEILDLLP